MKTETRTVMRKRINWSRTIVFVLFLYIIIYSCIYIYKAKVNHYEIVGNSYVSDSEILRDLDLDKYPPYLSISPSKLEKKLMTNPMIKSAKISFKLHFNIKIKIEENKPLFVIKSTNKVVLSNGKEINNDKKFIGLPLLLNDTPDKILSEFANNLGKVEDGIIYLINDIEYSPKYNENGELIDEKRFLLSMNDKNMVYLTSSRADALNYYLKITSAYEQKESGTLYLDSATESNIFKFPESTKKTTTKTTKKIEDDENED